MISKVPSRGRRMHARRISCSGQRLTMPWSACVRALTANENRGPELRQQAVSAIALFRRNAEVEQ